MKITEALCNVITEAGGTPTTADADSVTHALGTLYTTLGGTDTLPDDVADRINSLSDHIGGGGGTPQIDYNLVNIKNSTGKNFNIRYTGETGTPTDSVLPNGMTVACYVPKSSGYYQTQGNVCYLSAATVSADLANVKSSVASVRVGICSDNKTVLIGVFSDKATVTAELTITA